jgi:hypothetical protein
MQSVSWILSKKKISDLAYNVFLRGEGKDVVDDDVVG